jgi:hypothetical protein
MYPHDETLFRRMVTDRFRERGLEVDKAFSLVFVKFEIPDWLVTGPSRKMCTYRSR